VLNVLQIGNFVESVVNHTSLKELAFHEVQMQDLIDKALAENTNVEIVFNPLCLFHIFSQFLKNEMFGDDPFRRAHENQFVE